MHNRSMKNFKIRLISTFVTALIIIIPITLMYGMLIGGIWLMTILVPDAAAYLDHASDTQITYIVVPIVLIMIGAGTYLFYKIEFLLLKKFGRRY